MPDKFLVLVIGEPLDELQGCVVKVRFMFGIPSNHNGDHFSHARGTLLIFGNVIQLDQCPIYFSGIDEPSIPLFPQTLCFSIL